MENKETLDPEKVISALAKIVEDSNEEKSLAVGACIVTLPGSVKCFQLTPENCAALGGSYVGGKC